MRIPEIVYGLLARTIAVFVTPRPKHWIFGANYGKTYGEGPRNIMRYVLKHDSGIKCTWVTRNKELYKQLKKDSIPCEYNYSLKGMLAVAKSDCVFLSHVMSDIMFLYRKPQRQFYYLTHGQAYKQALGAARLSYRLSLKGEIQPFFPEFKSLLSRHLCCNVSINDSSFVSVCSEFIGQFTRLEFNKNVDIKVLGSPRNDALFDEELMQSEYFKELKGKFVVSYMPTHRLYGQGEPSPVLFIDNPAAQQWLRDNNVVVLIKQHPNMIPKIKDTDSNDVIIDITKLGLDPHVVIYHSDVLITDYSSVWMDYLLLRRPLIHFLYDDFGKDDAGFYYDLKEQTPGHIVESQEVLLSVIKKCKSDYSSMCPEEKKVRQYHKYVDGDSCKRHYEKIIKRYK